MSPESVIAQNQNFLAGKIEALDKGVATITLADGQTVKWPTDFLPAGSELGTEVKLAILNEASETERNKLAKAILNQVLKNKLTGK